MIRRDGSHTARSASAETVLSLRAFLRAIGRLARWAQRTLLTREYLVLASIVTLTWGTVIDFGVLTERAIFLVVLAVGIMLFAAAFSLPTTGAGVVAWSVTAAVTASATFLYSARLHAAGDVPLAVVLAGSVVLLIVGSSRTVRVLAGCVGGAAVVAVAVGSWTWGSSDIDVFWALQRGSSALLHGNNPYTSIFVVVEQTRPGEFARVAAHFLYLPGALLLTAPARLFGDVRLASAIAFIALGAFAASLAAQSPDRKNRVWRVASLALASPLTVAMQHWAWVDVFSVAGMAGWLALRRRHQRLSIVFLTVALVVKPTALIGLLPLWVWSRRVRLETAIALAGAVVVVLPFAIITGFGQYYQDVAGIFGQIGFRYDGLTLSAWWYSLTGSLIPLGVSLAIGVVCGALALRRRPRDTSDALLAGAFLTAAAFLLAKGAALNYYFVPVWVLILSLGAAGIPLDTADGTALPLGLSRIPFLHRRADLTPSGTGANPISLRRNTARRTRSDASCGSTGR